MQDSNLRPLACRAGVPPYQLAPDCDLRFGEPISAYHSDRDFLSSSLLAQWFRGGPAAFRSAQLRLGHDSPSTASLERGTLVHRCMEVGQAAFWGSVVEVPAEYVTEAGSISSGKAATAWRQSLPPDVIPLTAEMAGSIAEQIEAVHRNRAARELIEQGKWREFSVRWSTDEGHRLRCRPDMATPCEWIDFKTTKELSPLRTWHRSVRDFGYGHQNAIYRMGLRAAGWPDAPIHYIVSSTVPPYTCEVVVLPERFIKDCMGEVLAALADIQLRTEADYWLPDGYGQVHELSIPGYRSDR